MQRHWELDELVDHFTLLPQEVQLIREARTAHNRLGFAVLLKCFLLEGRFPYARHDVPREVVAHLAKQLDIPPSSYLHFEWRGRTASEQRRQIRDLLHFREATTQDGEELVSWLCTHLLTTHDRSLERLKATMYARCRSLQIEPPTPDRVERLTRTALATYNDRFHARILEQLSPETIAQLEALLVVPPPARQESDADDPDSAGRTPLQWLKADAGPMRLETATEEVAKLQRLRAIQLPPDLFAGIPPRVLRDYKQRVAAQDPHELRRQADALGMTLLAAFCWLRSREVTDTLVDLLMDMIHHVGFKAEQRATKELVDEITRVANKMGILRRIAETALDHPDGIIKEVLFPVVDQPTLQKLVVDLRATSLARRQRTQTVMRRSYGSYYRRMLPPLLEVLAFRSDNAVHRPVIEALELIKQYAGSDATYYAPEDDPPLDGVVPDIWRDLVVSRTRPRRVQIHRVNYEICVLQALRDKLRCKEIWVVGADRHRNPAEDLPQDFIDQRATYYADLKLPLDSAAFISGLQQEHEAALAMLEQDLHTKKNPYVRILPKAGGWIKLTPLTAQPDPPHLQALKNEVGERWWMTNLLDMVNEADARLHFTDVFKSLTGREHLDRETIQKRLLLCLYGLGTNTGLKRMAVGNDDVTYKDLLYIRRRFISCDHLRNAVTQIVNAILSARQEDIWGEATTTCASDSKKFSAWAQNLVTEWHARYHGPGIVIYWHVEKKATCIYSQLKTCSSSEVAAMITGVIRHCSQMEIDKQFVDSHGQSEVAFGICKLLNFQLCPRLKPIHSQKLYLPSADHADRYPKLKPVLTRAIDWELIRQQYDEMVKYATALKTGIADPEAILRRFTRHSTHPTYKAFIELGRVMKTLFLCHYLHKEELRREIQEGLNVIENWNSANSFIFYGRHGELATNRRDNQEVAMLALHLIQNCLVYINTLMIQDVLTEPAWMKRMTERDLRALTPLIYHHVNPYGIFALDVKKRLPFKELQAA